MSADLYNMKDLNFEVKFTMDEEGLRGLAKFLKEQDDEILDGIFSGKQGLILHDPKRGTAEVSRVVRCKDCKYNSTDRKCLNPKSIMDVPADDDYCSYGERREHNNERTD